MASVGLGSLDVGQDDTPSVVGETCVHRWWIALLQKIAESRRQVREDIVSCDEEEKRRKGGNSVINLPTPF